MTAPCQVGCVARSARRGGIAVGLVLLLSTVSRAATPVPAAVSSLVTPFPIGAGDSVLVVAPHPDDETLCCAGLLQRARALGARVSVVWLTNGDGFELDAMVAERTLRTRGKASVRLGERRLREGRAAASLLGVPGSSQYALGYPDRRLALLLGANLHQPLRSNYTRLSQVQGDDMLHPGADYTGDNLRRDLAEVLRLTEPTVVLAAAPEDRHADHAASGRLVAELLTEQGSLDRLHYWLVHGGREWPRPRHYHPQLALTPAPVARERLWQSFPLTAAEVAGKHEAILLHHTQIEVMAPFLLAFVRSNELYALPR